MSSKLIVPSLAGLSGTIMGIFGLGGGTDSTLDFNSNQLVAENSSYTWKLQPFDSSIEVSYKCVVNENGGGKKDFGAFSVKVEKEEINKVEGDLAKGKAAQVKINFGFNVDQGLESLKWLRDNREVAYMTVSNDWYQGGLRIALKEADIKARRGSDVNLSCKIDTQKGLGELQRNSQEVFRGWVDLKKAEQTVSLRNWGGTGKLSLYNCSLRGKSEGTTACDLKLTDSSGWMWSVRVSQKAKFQSTPVEQH